MLKIKTEAKLVPVVLRGSLFPVCRPTRLGSVAAICHCVWRVRVRSLCMRRSLEGLEDFQKIHYHVSSLSPSSGDVWCVSLTSREKG